MRIQAASPAPVPAANTPSDYDRALFELLRVLRRQFAEQGGVPPYIIFSDRALVEMATRYPQNEQQLLDINGVGQSKLAKYGAAFLDAICEHCRERGQTPRSTEAEPPAEATAWLTVKRRFQEIGELFAAGESIEALAARFDVKPRTIVQNLTRFQQTGGKLPPERLIAASHLPPPERERALAAFEQCGTGFLSPVHERLGGTVSYDELHLLRLYLLAGLSS